MNALDRTLYGVLIVPSIDYIPCEFRIALIAEVAHRVPKIDRPLMVMLDKGRESRGAFGEKLSTYLRYEPPCNSLSPMLGCHRQAVDVSTPSVPSADH